MNQDILDILLIACPILAAVLLFAFLLAVSKAYSPARKMKHAGRKAYEKLRAGNSGLMDYAQVKKYLDANGAAYHFGKSFGDPVAWVILRFGSAILFGFGGMYLNLWVGLLAAVAGFWFPPFLLKRGNDRDNIKMTPQIRTLYNTLQIQIKAGISVQNAMAEAYTYVPKGRLYDALLEFSTLLYMQNTFDEALNILASRFDNDLIDSFCIILRQAQESGRVIDLLADMATQIDDMQHSAQLKRKESLDRVTTFCLLGVMSATILIVVYAAILQMYAAVDFL